jgi:hypothetical protein
MCRGDSGEAYGEAQQRANEDFAAERRGSFHCDGVSRALTQINARRREPSIESDRGGLSAEIHTRQSFVNPAEKDRPMAKSAIVVNTVTLTNPNGAATDYALYALHAFDGQLYSGGWLNGEKSSPSNPDGIGLDRIYVSPSPTLDNFSQVKWTNGQSPGTWNVANGQDTLYNEIPNPGTETFSLQAYYGPSQPLGGSSDIYYEVNDPDLVGVGSNLGMFMTAVPCQNEYPGRPDPNGHQTFQLGWSTIGLATSSDGGATWTWKGTLPQLYPDGTPVLAPVTRIFPTDPTVTYNPYAAGNACPSAIFNDGVGLDLWYTHFNDSCSLPAGTPLLTLSVDNTHGVWEASRTCQLVTNAGTANFYVINPDVAVADDGSGTFWMVAQQWGGPQSGDLKLYYSATADGAEQGVNWHPWDGADGVLVEATNTLYGGLFDLVSPMIAQVGSGTLSIYYSVPTVLPEPGAGIPTNWEKINETFILPCFVAGTRIRTDHGEVAVEQLRVGDRVPVVRAGGSLPIVWIGYRRVEPGRHMRPREVYPVRVAAGAFADFVPLRDLWLSPEHCVFLHGVLVPVGVLLNGTSIAQVPCEEVTYWHVELASHDLMLCEGAWAESYLDMGTRVAFVAKGAGPVPVTPQDFSREAWEARACQQQERGGPIITAIKAAINARAAARNAA